MRHASLAFALAAALAACSVKDPLYCDGTTPCADPARPFCDLSGTYPASDGIKRTCIPYPWDASPDPDAGPACTPGEWTLDTIAAEGNVGFYSALVVDSSGTVHLAYNEQQKLWLASGRPGDWTMDDPGEPGGGYVQMKIDASETIHLVHGAWPAGLRYLRREAGAPEYSVEGASGDESYDITFDLDPSGVPLVCYTDATGGQSPKCVRRDSPSWAVLTAAPEVGLPIGVAIDSTGTIHLVMDTGTDATVYVQGDGESSWSEVEDAANAQPNKLVLDKSGNPHVTFAQTGSELRHATRVGPDDWSHDTIDLSAMTRGSVFAVGPDGSLHVAYRDEASAALKYAFRGSGAWEPETIDAESVIGGAGAIFIDARGGVHVSYSDGGNRDLKYAFRCPENL